MTTQATSTIEMKSWDEDRYADFDDGTGLSRAKVTQGLSGDVEGEGITEWLMFYRADGTADFVGLLRVSGRLGGREGSFVLQNRGTFDGSVAAGPVTVVPGSGSGELDGLRGQGDFSAPMGSTASLTLEYDVA
jgi:hypothetical protein